MFCWRNHWQHYFQFWLGNFDRIWNKFMSMRCVIQSCKFNVVLGTSTDGPSENSIGESVDIEPLIIDRGPYFDKTVSKNVTALVGKAAYLRCRVRNLSNKTVSTVWLIKDIRKNCLNTIVNVFYSWNTVNYYIVLKFYCNQ